MAGLRWPIVSFFLFLILTINVAQQDGFASEGTAEAMEEIRSAMSNQWDTLQHIRYQALVSKMTMGKLGARIKDLVNKISNNENPPVSRPPSEEDTCDEEQDKVGELGSLADAMEELLHVYANFVNSTDPKEEPANFQEDLAKMQAVVERLRTLVDKNLSINATTRSLESTSNSDFEGELRTEIVQKHDKVVLQCPVSSEYTGSWVRLRDNRILTAHGVVSINDDRFTTENYNLIIQQVQMSDKGRYQCQAMHRSSGRIATIVTYDVDVYGCAISVPSEAVEGTNQTLTCSYDIGSDNIDSIQWYFADEYFSHDVFFRYTSSGNPQLSTVDNSAVDVIREASVADRVVLREVSFRAQGIYSCVVRAKAFGAALMCRNKMVIVGGVPVPLPKKIVRINSLGDVSAERIKNATLSCRVTSNENVTVSWKRKRDQMLISANAYSYTNSTDYRVIHDEESNVWHLELPVVSTDDEFECRAIGSAAEDSDTVRLIVRDSALGDNHVAAELGSSAVLACKGSILSETVSWTRTDGVELLAVGLYTYTSNERISSTYDSSSGDWKLKIQDVVPRDAGTYECNVLGSNSKTVFTLTVIEPTISTEYQSNITVTEGSTAVLSCRVLNLGTSTVSWIYNDDQYLTAGLFTIAVDDRFTSTVEDSGVWQLRIQDVRSEDTGAYSCQVSSRTPIVKTTWLTVVGREAAKAEPRSCLPPFKLINTGVCILIELRKKLSWFHARQYCRDAGGDLAKEGDDSYIRTYLEQQFGISGETWTRWPFWLGGKREEVDGYSVWRWMDGTLVDAAKWAPDEPRPYSSRRSLHGTCLVLDGFQGYAATALPCSSKRRFVCRK